MGRKPLEKTVDLGGGFSVTLREPTPLELAGVLSGDAATLGDKLLRVSIKGSGGWRARSPEDVDAFLRDGHYSPGELALLLREARAFVAECILNARGAAFYEMNQAATTFLSGGRTRSEMVAGRRSIPDFTLPRDDGEDVSDGGEEFLMSEELSPEEALIEKEEGAVIDGEAEKSLRDLLEDDRLTVRDWAIVEARAEGKTLKTIGTDLGISHEAARQAWTRIKKKARKIRPS